MKMTLKKTDRKKPSMKKTALLTLALLALASTSAFGAGLTFNGNPVPSDVAPVIVEGRTLVPVKVINELLEGKTQWNEAAKTVILTKGDKTIIMTLGSQKVTVNGSAQHLDVPAQAVKGRTMVPLSFVAQHLGAKVDWDATTKTAAITTQSKATATGKPSAKPPSKYPAITKALDDSKDPVAPSFELKDAKGNSVSLKDYRGKFVLINAFASWCGPCVRELPFLNEVYQHFGNNEQDVVVVGLCAPGTADDLDHNGMLKFIKDKKLNYTILLDESAKGTVFNSYVEDAIPITYIISPNGKVVYKEVGAVSSAKKFIEPLEKLLEGKSIK